MFGKPTKHTASSSKEAVSFLSGPSKGGDAEPSGETVESAVQEIVTKYGYDAVSQAVAACEPEGGAETTAEPGEEAAATGAGM